MKQLLFRHKVEDQAKWRSVFDANVALRKAAGSKGARVFSSASDPNELLILFEWESLESARRFAETPELQERIKRAGVGQHDVYFLEEIERTSA